MRALLAKDYIEEFDLKNLSKIIIKNFDEYNYKQFVAQQHIDASLGHPLIERLEAFTNKKSDPTELIVEKRQNLIKSIDKFDKTLKLLKDEFTDDERDIFHYTVEERETDKEARAKICKSEKTYYYIKKSCYVKIVLKFNWLKDYDSLILKTISLND